MRCSRIALDTCIIIYSIRQGKGLTSMIKEIEIPNGVVSYYRVGNGPPLVMLNGYGGNFSTWPNDFKQKLSQNYELIFFNYREVGYTNLTKSQNTNYTINALAEDLHQFIHALNLKNISLFAFSMGGYVAQEFALHFKEEINLFILCACKIGGQKAIAVDPEILQKLLPSNKSEDDEIETELKLNFPANEINLYRDSQKERHRISQLPENLITAETRFKQRAAVGLWIKSFNEEKYSQYEKIKSKTNLLISGLKDTVISYKNSIILSQHLKNSQVLFFDNGGHGILRQHPIAIARYINSFT